MFFCVLQSPLQLCIAAPGAAAIWLEKNQKWTKAEIAKAAERHPPLLRYGIKEKLEPRVAWLSEDLDWSDAEASNFL